MKIFALLLSLLLVSNFVRAQEAKNPVVLEKVNYSRSFPSSLRGYIPKEGKSRFWGETKLKHENKPVWVHFYDVQKTYFPKDAVNVYGTQRCGLDLFIFQTPRQLKRISTTRFSYKRYGSYETDGALERVGLQTLWLDPKTKKMPILQLDVMDPNGILGTISQEILFVFDSRFNKSIVQPGFGYGNSNGSGMNGWNTSYGNLDENGNITIIVNRGGMEEKEETIYKWKKNRFEVFSTVRSKTIPDNYYEQNFTQRIYPSTLLNI